MINVNDYIYHSSMTPLNYKSGISLLPEDIKQERTSKVRAIRVRLVTLMLLVVSVVLAGATAFGLGYVNNINKDLNQKIDSQKQQLLTLRTVWALVQSFNNRISSADNILKGRQHYSLLIEVLGQTTPEKVLIKDVVLNKDQLRVSGVAEDYADIAQFVYNSKNVEIGGLVFSSIELSGITLDTNNNKVNFSSTLYLKEGGLIYEL